MSTYPWVSVLIHYDYYDLEANTIYCLNSYRLHLLLDVVTFVFRVGFGGFEVTTKILDFEVIIEIKCLGLNSITTGEHSQPDCSQLFTRICL